MISLAGHEIRRTLRPAQAALLTGLCVLLAYEKVRGAWGPTYAQVQGALTLHGGWLVWSISILAGAAGGSLADEQRKGVTSTLLTKGISRGQYLLSKVLGAAGSAAVLMAAAICGFYVLVAILWPAGQVTYNRTATGPGPVPALYAMDPLANDLMLASMSVVASACMSTWGVLAGTLTTNRYVAMLTPLSLLILGMVFHEYGANRWLNPFTYLDLRGYYAHTIPPAWRPYAAFLYWSCLAVVVAALSRWIFVKKELT